MTTPQIGYCTNVHAGANLDQTRTNLLRYACVVKEKFSPTSPMGIGLWLSASSAARLVETHQVTGFAEWLREVGLLPFTLNGFPYGDFHRDIVKHAVYHPTWFEPERLAFTKNLIAILHELLPEGLRGSISTVPIAWGTPSLTTQQIAGAVEALRDVANTLSKLEKETGRYICLCLEPEPGCVLTRSEDVLEFFQVHLFRGGDEDILRRHIQVCHDICHQVVMFEDQAAVLRRYHDAGIGVGKIQVSSAVQLPFADTAHEHQQAALTQLKTFDEHRYLHQTCVAQEDSTKYTFYEDLGDALAAEKEPGTHSDWRVHFHVPIYLERFGHLRASQKAILECIRRAAELELTDHFEVETYAWGVLPPEIQQPNLASGIAEEMEWFRQSWNQMQNA
ncbi:MAG: metabolite traffic protein EboE [Gemmataceae bacterium]